MRKSEERLIDTVKNVKTSTVLNSGFKLIRGLWVLFVLLSTVVLSIVFFQEVQYRDITEPELFMTIFGLVLCGIELKSKAVSRFFLGVFK